MRHPNKMYKNKATAITLPSVQKAQLACSHSGGFTVLVTNHLTAHTKNVWLVQPQLPCYPPTSYPPITRSIHPQSSCPQNTAHTSNLHKPIPSSSYHKPTKKSHNNPTSFSWKTLTSTSAHSQETSHTSMPTSLPTSSMTHHLSNNPNIIPWTHEPQIDTAKSLANSVPTETLLSSTDVPRENPKDNTHMKREISAVLSNMALHPHPSLHWYATFKLATITQYYPTTLYFV